MAVYYNGTNIPENDDNFYYNGTNLDKVYYNNVLVWNKAKEYTLTFNNSDSYLYLRDPNQSGYNEIYPGRCFYDEATLNAWESQYPGIPFDEGGGDEGTDYLGGTSSFSDAFRPDSSCPTMELPAVFRGTGISQRDSSGWSLTSTSQSISPALSIAYPPTVTRNISATITNSITVYPVYSIWTEGTQTSGCNWWNYEEFNYYVSTTPVTLTAAQLNSALRVVNTWDYSGRSIQGVTSWYANDWERNWCSNGNMFPPNYTGYNYGTNLEDANSLPYRATAGVQSLVIDWWKIIPGLITNAKSRTWKRWSHDSIWWAQDPTASRDTMVLEGVASSITGNPKTNVINATVTPPVWRFYNQNDRSWYADVTLPTSGTVNFTSMTFKKH